MLLVYTHKITPRVKYVFKHICTRILGVKVSFTTKIEDFIAHDSLKMSYTKQPLSSEFFIKSHDILFEQGLSDVDINIQKWDQTKCFFFNGDKSVLTFDIFSASFYMLSRYEEYLPHLKDSYGRFTATESLAYKEGFLHQPVVDIWAYKFKEALSKNYPDFEWPQKKYSVIPVIDVPTAYKYRLKGVIRKIGGSVKDILRLRFRSFYARFMVVLGFRHDPYDTYKYLINRFKSHNINFVFFFLIGEYSTYDKGINPNKKQLVSLIKHIADYCRVGLKVSYFAIEDEVLLKKEKLKMENILNTNLKASRQSFSKVNLPETYRKLIELEIFEDYTMGYVNHVGFRAGTCSPFFFYDLDYEIQTPLKVIPYQIMDYALLKHKSFLDKKKAILELVEEIKQVNGLLVPVFHNYTFGEGSRWSGFKELFNLILESTNED